MNEAMEFDGERFTPECVREIWYEHFHRYVFASRVAGGRSVLDAACGEGYGSDLMARVARKVTGVDTSAEAIEHARARYPKDNLEFRQADCCDLPFDADEFECIVSFETIEHLDRQEEMIGEFRRVLKPEGFLLISSPDKAVYSDARNFRNEHHVRELYAYEFSDLLERHFPALRLFGQKLLFQSGIWPLESETSPGNEPPAVTVGLDCFRNQAPQAVTRPVHPPMYLLALCAAEENALPSLDSGIWLFDDEEESVYKHYQHEIRKNMSAGTILAEREQQLDEVRKKLALHESDRGFAEPWWRRFNPLRRGKS